MRVLIATRYRGVVGGIETYLRWLLPALDRAGCQAAVAWEEDAEPGCPTIDSGGVRGFPLSLDAVLAWKPDVVYLQQPLAPRNQTLLSPYPLVLFAHNYFGTCISGRKTHRVPHCQPCGRTFGPACLLLYYPRRCGGLNPVTAVRAYAREARLNASLPQYQTILAASTHMRDEYLRHGGDPSRVHVLHLPPSDLVRDPVPPAERPLRGRLIFAGRLTDLKGGHTLVPAVTLAQQALDCGLSLTIMGSGPGEEEIRRQARRGSVPVSFAGWIEGGRRAELLRESDLLVVPSLWPEPFGLAGVEAACLGVPAAAFDVGGIREWLLPGQTGEIAPGTPPTAEGLAGAIVRAFHDSAHWRSLRRGAWLHARRFDPRNHISGLLAHLEAAARCVPV